MKKVSTCLVIGLLLGLIISSQYLVTFGSAQEPFFKIVIDEVAFPLAMSADAAVARELRKLNIDAKTVMIDLESFIVRHWGGVPDFYKFRGKTFEEGGYDMFLMAWSYGPLKGAPHHWDYISSSITDTYTRNPGLINDTIVDQLFEEILRYDYMNVSQRKIVESLYEQINHRLIDELCALIPVCTIPFVAIARDDIEGIPPGAGLRRWDLKDVHFRGQERGANLSLTIGIGAEITMFGPVFMSTEPRVVQEPLFSVDARTGYLRPVLATGYEWFSENNTFRIHLREGVRWHDGVPFNATDVWGWMYKMLDPNMIHSHRATAEDLVGSIDNVRIVDEYTVDLYLPNGFKSTIYDLLNYWDGGAIQPWHIVKNFKTKAEQESSVYNTGVGTYTVDLGDGKTYVAHGPIGTGPYKFMGYDPKTKTFTLERNEDYWGPKPWLKQIKFVYIPDIEAAIAALKSGQVDLIYDDGTHWPIFSKIPELEGQPGIQVIVNDYARWFCYVINMQHPILGTGVETPLGKMDPSRAAEAAAYVRKAIACAIPREMIAKSLFAGYGKPLYSLRPPTLWGCQEKIAIARGEIYKPYPYNLTKAREYLEMAGYKVTPPSEAMPTWVWGVIIGVGIAVPVVVVAIIVLRRKRKMRMAEA